MSNNKMDQNLFAVSNPQRSPGVFPNQNPNSKVSFSCPSCKGELYYSENEGYVCNSCHQRYKLFHGIPVFSRDTNYYYGEMPKDIFCELIALSKKTGVQNAMNDLLRSNRIGKGVYNYGSARNRGAFFPLLSLGSAKRVLDLGCGWGNVSLTLARVFGECFAMDLTKERVLFLQLRALEMGYNNIFFLCGGDLRYLPFKDEFFDCVVLNGVLEWIPEMRQGVNPRTLQSDYLMEVYRVLKRNGQLYLAIENRYALEYLTGMREDHTGMLFTSFMPRRMADRVSRKIRSKPYRTWTYSKKGYAKLLRGAGFKSFEFWLPWPNYRQFNTLVKLGDSRALLRHIRRNGYQPSWRTRIKVKLTRYMNHSFSIVANKGRRQFNSWLCNFTDYLNRIYKASNGELDLPEITITHTSGIGLSYKGGGGKGLYIGLPVDQLSELNHLRQYEALCYISRSFPELREMISKAIERGVFEGVSYFVYSLVENQEILTDMEQVRQCFLKVTKIFATRHVVSEEVPENLKILRVLEAIESSGIRLFNRDLFVKRYEYLLKETGPLRHPMHGDLWKPNVLTDSSSRYFLIDWADFSKCGLPLHDLFHCIIYNGLDGNERFKKMISMAYAGFPDKVEKNLSWMMSEVYDRKAYSFGASRLSALYILYLYEHIVRRVRRGLNKKKELEMLIQLTSEINLPLPCFKGHEKP